MAENDPTRWNERYEQGRDGWTLDGPPQILLSLIESLSRAGPMRVIVPGAGVGHDALAWAQAGHEVVALDFAPAAVARLRERAAEAGLTIEAHVADVTNPGPALNDRLGGRFDLVWEQTCLCAIMPELRGAYLAQARSWLTPDGSMLALLWNTGNEGGPPYDMPPELVERLMTGLFVIDKFAPVTGSNPNRREHLYWLRPEPT